MKFKESKVLVQLDSLISRHISKSYLEDLSDSVWDDGGESLIKDLYEGDSQNVFAHYMMNNKIDINDDLWSALDEVYYGEIQSLKAKILSIIVVRIYDTQIEIKDQRVIEVDQIIDRYINLMASKDIDEMTREKLEIDLNSPITPLYRDTRSDVFDLMKATHIAYILKEALNYNRSEIINYR